MMETPYRHDVQITCYQMASRLGKTEVFMNIIGHSITERPRRIIVMYPTKDNVEKWSKETFETELVSPTPALQFLERGGRRDSSNTITHKLFPGGLLTALGANPKDLRRAKGSLLITDEIDSIDETKTDEGDAIEILWMRGSEYPDCIKIAASYPSVKGHSRLNKMLLESDCRKWFTPCHSCGGSVIMLREHITYPDGEPEKAELLCPDCTASINEAQRREMMMNGEWRATLPFHGIAGFWGNGLMSPHPVQKGYASVLHWVAAQELKAESADNPARAKRVLVNTFDAEPYQPETLEAPEASILMDRRESFTPRDMLPEDVLILQFGIDVQKRWIEPHIWGFGLNKESWHIESKKINGPVESQSTWDELEAYLHGCKFPHPIAGHLSVFADRKRISGFIDAGHWPDIVLNWSKKMKPLGVYAIQGSPTINAPIVSKPRINTLPKAKVFPLGVNQAKDIVYARLATGRDPSSDKFPEGYVHFSDADDVNFFEGLTAEYGKEEYFRGELFTRYVCPKGKRNEPLDCYVYALASSIELRPNFGRIAANMVKPPANTDKNSSNSETVTKKTVAKKSWATDI
jgi:phage terminase large subunit GpA-like protein